MKNCCRVLHIVGGLNIGGIENFIMNIYRNIDREKIQFDFLIHQKEKQYFEDEVLKLGGKIFRVSSLKTSGYRLYIKEIKRFFKENKQYKIIHSHYNEVSGIILPFCNKDSKRIAHSHAAYPKYSNFLVKLFAEYIKRKLKNNCEYRFACSKAAGEWLYGKNTKFCILNNGIEMKKFLFNNSIREKMRKALELEENEVALVSVARLSYQKNHIFMLNIMKELNKLDLKYKLFFIGEGELENKLKNIVQEKGIKNIYFLGAKKNIGDYLNAMDIMLFPSLSEGLGITAIEAQSNGLLTLASQFVPEETNMGLGLFKRLDISKLEEWIEQILKLENLERVQQSKEEIEKILTSDYNIESTVKKLEEFYLKLEK